MISARTVQNTGAWKANAYKPMRHGVHFSRNRLTVFRTDHCSSAFLALLSVHPAQTGAEQIRVPVLVSILHRPKFRAYICFPQVATLRQYYIDDGLVFASTREQLRDSASILQSFLSVLTWVAIMLPW
eukprot:3859558-Amphidinium_carterae.1